MQHFAHEAGFGRFRHVDPESEAPDISSWSPFWRAAYESGEMDVLRACLRVDETGDVRASVIDDLATYFDVPPEECLRRCLDWGTACIEEWNASATPLEFHRETTSSSFSLLWYAYLQAVGAYFPVSVALARIALRRSPPGTHLDFGSGAGVTSQLFQALGYETTLADVARVTLDFARFRFRRRGRDAAFIDLNEASLPDDAYDVITAIDVLAHVPDVAATAHTLHRALRRGGILYANINVSARTKDAPWHLHDDQRLLRRDLQTAGFEPIVRLDYNYGEIYRRVDESGPIHTLRALRDWLQFGPTRPVAAAAIRRIRDGGARRRKP